MEITSVLLQANQTKAKPESVWCFFLPPPGGRGGAVQRSDRKEGFLFFGFFGFFSSPQLQGKKQFPRTLGKLSGAGERSKCQIASPQSSWETFPFIEARNLELK